MRTHVLLLMLLAACRMVDGALPGDRDITDLVDPPGDRGDDTMIETEDFAPGDRANAELLEYAAEFDLDPDPAGVHRPGAKPGEPCELGWFTCESESTLIGCNPATRRFISYLCPIRGMDGCFHNIGDSENRCVRGRGCIYGTGPRPAGTAVEPSPAYLPNPSQLRCIGRCGWDDRVTCEPDYTYHRLVLRLGEPCVGEGVTVCSIGVMSRGAGGLDEGYPNGGQIVCGEDGVWAWSGACSAAGCAPVDRSCPNCPVDGTRCVELVPAPDPRTLGDGGETDADDEAAEGAEE